MNSFTPVLKRRKAFSELCVFVPVLRFKFERSGSDFMNDLARVLLIVLLILLLIGLLPAWPYSAGWGYYPSGGLGLILIVVVVVLAIGGPRGNIRKL